MDRGDLNDLASFAVVAEEQSFTRAAAKLRMSQSALSHAIKGLEVRLGVSLLARTTRSVSATDAGQQLLRILQPALRDIDAELAALGQFRDKPSGSIRIATAKHPAIALLWPKISLFLSSHPDVSVELTVDEGWTDIVAGRYDAGVRLGESLEKDMIAARIGPDIRSAVVATPEYFRCYSAPQMPHDLASHNCINYRQTSSGGIYAWEFEKDGQELSVKVNGSLVFNDIDLIEAAVLDGRGLAQCFEEQVAVHIVSGRLVRVLEDWCPLYPGFHLYYPSRRRTPALSALIEVLRWRGSE
ncbi:LysR family transcriptional regulator [Rhizobium leguminosarum]|uniref:LysR family transcriptional regulator n=1 Tax=Rhizobium leguminosarum TaxID=384 RepID=UPI001C92279F|nr:LysR family transcriptional regulator [Rhizobium leguminosarum]MBY2927036.1 LysR family transcriptional regulator [Rhizobium leguminosarum]